MTDRHRGYVVTLDEDIRSDDAALIINAIQMIRRVVSVEPIINDPGAMISEARVRHDMTMKIYEALKTPRFNS